MSSPIENSEAAILDRVFRPTAADWSRAAAEAIMKIEFDASDREKVTELLDRAKAGDLTEEQAQTLEHYRHVGRLLELMKSRARHSLRNTPAS